MSRAHFIGLDVHCQFTELAVVTATGRLTQRHRCATTIPALAEALQAIARPRYVAVEEGPLADWVWRNLVATADGFTVCDPRRNHLIANDGDKDDPVDAAKLAHLLRGGYLKAVHHPAALERVLFKQHVALYHERVRQRVREANRLLSVFRRQGVFVRERAFATPAGRADLLGRLPPAGLLREDLAVLWQGYDAVAAQVRALRRRLVERAKAEDVVRRWVAVPGVKWVRAATLFVYLDTPARFASKAALWRYLGVGLERRHSGSGPARVRVGQHVNRLLRGMLLGAAKSALAAADNPFAAQYERWLAGGIAARNAQRNVARSLAAVLWGMWKNGTAYHPEWVGAAAAAGPAGVSG